MVRNNKPVATFKVQVFEDGRVEVSDYSHNCKPCIPWHGGDIAREKIASYIKAGAESKIKLHLQKDEPIKNKGDELLWSEQW